MSGVRWGISSTILAPARDVLRFAAYHLELGAHRLYIYLDAETPTAFNHLKEHPKIRVRTCDLTYWSQRGGRPDKHQARQSVNATHAYNRKAEVDWLAHIDVDEFLVPGADIGGILASLPAETLCARARPMELLGASNNAFKAFIPAGPARQRIVRQIYPTFGSNLRAGFLSHVAGKVFVRTGLPDITVQIHNAFQNKEVLKDVAELVQIDLAHCHAVSWQAWRAAFQFRLERGSYRAKIKPAQPQDQGGISTHDMLAKLAAEDGETGLRAFYDEVIADSPDMRARLNAHGLLRHVDLNLDAVLSRHFPDAAV